MYIYDTDIYSTKSAWCFKAEGKTREFTKKMIATLVAISTIMILGCSSLVKRNPSAIIGKHYIITLHGVRGNEASFGDFHSLIKLHLEQTDSAYTVVPLNITYTTGLLNFDPHTVAQEINLKLDDKITQLNPEDKISVVAYSMGGQVGSIWYFDALKSEKYKKYALQTSKFISLGSPFWGSKEASLGVSVDNMFGQMDPERVVENAIKKLNLKDTFLDTSQNRQKALNTISNTRKYLSEFIKNYDTKVMPKSKISFAELSALALGSDITNEIRLNHIKYKNNTHWISISTLINCFETNLDANTPGCQNFQNILFKKLNFDIFGKYTFGYVRRETDNSVITPSANAHFLYFSDSDSNYADGLQTPATKFLYSGNESNHKFYLAEGLHATLVPATYYDKALKILGIGGEAWQELADDVVLVYAKTCQTPETCKHPSYKYIVKELADCQRVNSTCDKVSEENYVQTFFTDKEKYGEKDQSTLRSEIHGFTLEVNLRVPKGYDLSKINHRNVFDYLKAEFSDTREHSIKLSETKPYTILLARPAELGSLTINKVTQHTNQDQLRVVMTGLIIPKVNEKHNAQDLEKGVSFDFDIRLPGLRSRKIQALVRPYYSTYVDLLMVKK